jgi:hypothetical protein
MLDAAVSPNNDPFPPKFHTRPSSLDDARQLIEQRVELGSLGREP